MDNSLDNSVVLDLTDGTGSTSSTSSTSSLFNSCGSPQLVSIKMAKFLSLGKKRNEFLCFVLDFS